MNGNDILQTKSTLIVCLCVNSADPEHKLFNNWFVHFCAKQPKSPFKSLIPKCNMLWGNDPTLWNATIMKSLLIFFYLLVTLYFFIFFKALNNKLIFFLLKCKIPTQNKDFLQILNTLHACYSKQHLIN